VSAGSSSNSNNNSDGVGSSNSSGVNSHARYQRMRAAWVPATTAAPEATATAIATAITKATTTAAATASAAAAAAATAAGVTVTAARIVGVHEKTVAVRVMKQRRQLDTSIIVSYDVEWRYSDGSMQMRVEKAAALKCQLGESKVKRMLTLYLQRASILIVAHTSTANSNINNNNSNNNDNTNSSSSSSVSSSGSGSSSSSSSNSSSSGSSSIGPCTRSRAGVAAALQL
jgi:uncharacterized membrane protein YgcG